MSDAAAFSTNLKIRLQEKGYPEDWIVIVPSPDHTSVRVLVRNPNTGLFHRSLYPVEDFHAEHVLESIWIDVKPPA